MFSSMKRSNADRYDKFPSRLSTMKGSSQDEATESQARFWRSFGQKRKLFSGN